MELIPMTDFVLKNLIANYSDGSSGIRTDIGSQGYYVVYYAKFLKQPLTLGMFVPCDEDGDVLEFEVFQGYVILGDNKESKKNKISKGDTLGFIIYEGSKYQAAKERVLFEFEDGINILRNKDNFFIIEDKNGVYLRVLKKNTKTSIESLLKLSVKITLTQTAIKQINE